MITQKIAGLSSFFSGIYLMAILMLEHNTMKVDIYFAGYMLGAISVLFGCWLIFAKESKSEGDEK